MYFMKISYANSDTVTIVMCALHEEQYYSKDIQTYTDC
jgi:hypothetical protein